MVRALARRAGIRATPQVWKKSYAQSGEDLIVLSIFNSLKLPTPTYLDIGAHDPLWLSNTALFYEMGAHGITIEPDPTLFARFPRARPRDINLNIGIADRAGEMEFYRMSAPTLNTFSRAEAESYVADHGFAILDTTPVLVDTLDHVLDVHWGGTCPAFLSLDVEGLEMMILRTLDLARHGPVVMCVETASYSETGRPGNKDHELISFVRGHGYITYADTYLNTIFVRADAWSR